MSLFLRREHGAYGAGGTTAEAKPTATKPHATAPTKKPTTTKVAPTKATGPVTNGENPFVEFDENGNPVPIGATDFRRSLGYCELYDNMAPYAAMDFDTVRIKFRYDNLDWMVQMWKGQYGPSIGCEIGVYHKPTTRMVEFYDCATDENSLVMEAPFTGRGNSFSVCHAASIGGPRRLIPACWITFRTVRS